MKKIKHMIKQTFRRVSGFHIIIKRIEDLKMLTAKQQINQIKLQGQFANIREAEFRVFSQFGDDGIIQYLINNLDINNKSFIEFGVGKYLESNTRFLLMNDNWKGLVIEADQSDVEYIKNDEIYWKYELEAVNSFITKDNINGIFLEHGFSGDIGLLSIDIDGNDYWIWDSIEVVNPVIVIVEYNSIFGTQRAVTIPYDPKFVRIKAHYSNLYWGASLKALNYLAQRKGYIFVGCNNGGNNAYFVRNDKAGFLKALTVGEGFIGSRFREARDAGGRLSFLPAADQLKTIKDMPIFDVELGKIMTVESLLEES